MKKKILLFEPDELFRNTLLEQISLNKDFDVTEVSSFDDVQYQLVKSSFDLLIMGTDTKTYRLSSIGRFIKDAKITSVVLFMIDPETSESLSFEGRKKNTILLRSLSEFTILIRQFPQYWPRFQTLTMLLTRSVHLSFFRLKKL
jgi:hypothetical protein